MDKRFPPWLRRPWPSGEVFGETKSIVQDLGLHTVCQSARCPNLGECWANGTATVMVLGNVCTRNCGFCSVSSGKSGQTDPNEPSKVAQAVSRMGLKHTVLTTVARDDLPDGGASHIADTIRAIRAVEPEMTIEILVSDFNGDMTAVDKVLDAEPDIFSHNVETVPRLYPQLRDPRFSYESTLEVLRYVGEASDHVITKSAIMVGHGETPDEVVQVFSDLVGARCEVMCVGQYLRPTRRQRAVEQYIHPRQFERYDRLGYDAGFKFMVSGPFVRSSYRSEEILETDFAKAKLRGRVPI